MQKDVLISKKTEDSRANETIISFRLALWVTALLLASGFAHLAMMVILGASWDGPLSLRKPALFGISGGMWLLTLSCGLGILTSIMGELSIASGKSYQLWGKAGVWKFPHGVALHAIQLLPFLAWLALVLRVPKPERLVQATLVSQGFFLVYAVWQTSQGLDRFEMNAVGSLLLGGVFLSGLFPAIAIANGFLSYLIRKT